MATQKCWKCGRSFQVLDDEVGCHGCPNQLCANYDLLDSEIGEDEEEEYE